MYNYYFDVIGSYGFDGVNVHIPLFNSIGQILNTLLLILVVIKVF